MFFEVSFQKSPVARTFQRSFKKVDEFFSYVGGIIGTIIGIIFFLNIFAEKGYSVSVASQLFVSEEGESISSSGFHIGYMPMMILRSVLSFFGCCPGKWKKTDFYQKCIDEVDQQLDIVNLMKKIMFLEKAVHLLFPEHQLQALHLHEK